MLVAGLTGGIGSGKSTVSQMLRDEGIPVICADNLARLAVQRGSRALEGVRRLFGDSAIDAEGNLDRQYVAQLVFRDPAKRQQLESLIHPEVARRQEELLDELRAAGARIAVVDVPLLYECSWQDIFDLVIVVHVPREVQISRMKSRDNMSDEEADARLEAQMAIDEKKRLANVVVDNSGSTEQTRDQVRRLVVELESLARYKQGHEGDED